MLEPPSQKIILVNAVEVRGNLIKYPQSYSIKYLPPDIQLKEKLVLNVNTDVSNSLRFENDIDIRDFILNLCYSYLTFREIKLKPQLKEQFRIGQLNELLVNIQRHLYRNWKV